MESRNSIAAMLLSNMGFCPQYRINKENAMI